MLWTSPGKCHEDPARILPKKTLMGLIFQPSPQTRDAGETSVAGLVPEAVAMATAGRCHSPGCPNPKFQ